MNGKGTRESKIFLFLSKNLSIAKKINMSRDVIFTSAEKKVFRRDMCCGTSIIQHAQQGRTTSYPVIWIIP